MLTIRLQRTGRKNLVTYRVVAAEHARPVKGKFIAILGNYMPQQKDSPLTVDVAKVDALVAKGAVVSDTLARLLKNKGVKGMDRFIRRYAKQRSKSAPAEEPAAPPPAPAPVAQESAGDSAPAQA